MLQVPSRPRMIRERASTITDSTGDGSRTTVTDASTTLTTPDLEDEEDDDDELDREILQNHEELARLSFAKKDYATGASILQEAIAKDTGTSSDPARFQRLKLQLSICYCLQGKWEAGEGVLVTLGKANPKTNMPVYYLLHAVALAHLVESRHERAHLACKRSLQGKKKAQGKASRDYFHSMSLLAAIEDARGKDIEAKAIRLSIPKGKLQEVFPDPTQFILDHRFIIEAAFGDAITPKPTDNDGDAHSSESESELEDTPQAQSKGNEKALSQEQDTAKEMVVEPGNRWTHIGTWDTGKEISVNATSSGDNITIDPASGRRIFAKSPPFDTDTGKILSWPDWEALKWTDLMHYLSSDGAHLIYDLIVDDNVRQMLGLPRKGMADEAKWSDLLVCSLEQSHERFLVEDSFKEVVVMPPPPPQSTKWENLPPAPIDNRPVVIPPLPKRNAPRRPPTPNLIDLDTELLSPIMPLQPVQLHRHRSARSADFSYVTSATEWTNNPFRRTASQRTLNHSASSATLMQMHSMASLRPDAGSDGGGLRHMASFDGLSQPRPYQPPAPWIARRYGERRDCPQVLASELVFLRGVPHMHPQDGVVLGVHLGMEIMEVAGSLGSSGIKTCPSKACSDVQFLSPYSLTDIKAAARQSNEPDTGRPPLVRYPHNIHLQPAIIATDTASIPISNLADRSCHPPMELVANGAGPRLAGSFCGQRLVLGTDDAAGSGTGLI